MHLSYGVSGLRARGQLKTLSSLLKTRYEQSRVVPLAKSVVRGAKQNREENVRVKSCWGQPGVRSRRQFSLAAFFHVTHDGLSEGGTNGSLHSFTHLAVTCKCVRVLVAISKLHVAESSDE